MRPLTELLAVEAIGAEGDGVARRQDGKLVHLPGALAGETVLASFAGGRARITGIASPSPERVAPPCVHFAEGCGGCTLQHWAIPAQSAWKRQRVSDALHRAGFRDFGTDEAVPTPPGSRRRADLAARRLASGEVVCGLHVRGEQDVLAIPGCLVLRPAIVALIPPLRSLLRSLPALRRVASVVVNLLDSGPDVLLRLDGPVDAASRRLLAAFAEREGVPRIACAVGGGVPEVAAQVGPVRHSFAGVGVAPPPGAFLQPSSEGEAAIVAAVLAALPVKPPRPRILDLFAGLGTLSLPLAARGRVTAVEGDAGAAAALKATGRVTALRRDLARQPFLAAALKDFDVVVLDPPYAGAPVQVAQIARSAVRHVIYVSCNPVALAREAAALRAAGFALATATPVDQFRWSAHLESIVAFKR